MTDDQGKENSASDRLEEIKKEEKEDASSYYEQGESKDNINEEVELSKPVENLDEQKEEMNMLKAVAFLGFGMAALSIIFILFFVRDLDTRVVDVDGAVTSLEQKMAPLRKHVDSSLEKVNKDISGLNSKIGNYERIMAVMELKRALVTVQEMSMGDSAHVKDKSNQVVAGIESLLAELGDGTSPAKMPGGTVSLEEAPINSPDVPTPEPIQAETELHKEPAAEEEQPANTEEVAPVVEETAAEAIEEETEAGLEGASAEEGDGDGEEETEAGLEEASAEEGDGEEEEEEEEEEE